MMDPFIKLKRATFAEKETSRTKKASSLANAEHFPFLFTAVYL